MKWPCFWALALMSVTLGCRMSDGPFGSILPGGTSATRVPPPVTGSIGTPIPQPTAQQYYPGGSASAAAPPANNIGWQAAPSTSLSVNPATPGGAVPTTPVLNNNPHVAALNPAAAGVMGTAPNGVTPQVTNPPVIRNQATPVNVAPGSGTRTATNPWQPATGAPASPQLLNANAAPAANAGTVNSALGNTLGITSGGAAVPPTQPVNPPANGAWGQPDRWGQPATGQPSSGGSQIPVGNPSSQYQLQGMPVNDATSQYPPASAWSLTAWRQWWLQRQHQAQQPNPRQYYQQPQAVAPAAYASAAPQPAPLPVRGLQTTIPTANNTTVTPAAAAAGATSQQQPAAPSTAPAVQQWGGLPMASIQPISFTSSNPASQAATVRGNNDGDGAPAAATPTQTSVSPAAGRFAYDPQYAWLRGQLEYSITERRWKLRYIPHDAPEGRIDSFGGSVVLTPTEKIKGFESGAFVTVHGRIAATEAGSSDYAPIYSVDSVSGQ